MSDWTTLKIGDGVEIDLHYDLDCFPFVIRGGPDHGTVVLSKAELLDLYTTLKVFFAVNEEAWRKYLNEST